MHDAHLHLRDIALLKEMSKHAVAGIANAQDPCEYAKLKQAQTEWDKLYISAGMHPWNANWEQLPQMYPIMEDAPLIGEIGLDSVWCQTDRQVQMQVFEASLAFAQEHQKPVILHIKGMEQEALSFLKRYPNTYLVHWYSCQEYLEEYMQLGCWFTIGPSVGSDEAVTQVALQAPIEKLLIETDGIEAVEWCDARKVDITDYASILKRSIQRIATLRGLSCADLEHQLDENFGCFLRLAGIHAS